MCWLCGQYLAGRIVVIIIMVFIIILCFISCYRDYGKNIIGCLGTCLNYILYKKAKVFPVQLAIETNIPINAVAIPIKTHTVIIVNE